MAPAHKRVLAYDKIRHARPSRWWSPRPPLAADGGAVDVDVEILPAMPEVTDALAPDAPRIWDIPDNIAFSWADGDEAAVDAAFDRAAHVSKVSLFDNRLAPVSMEPRGGIGEWDASRVVIRSQPRPRVSRDQPDLRRSGL